MRDLNRRTTFTFPYVVVHRTNLFFQQHSLREILIFGHIIQLHQFALALLAITRMVPIELLAREMIEEIKEKWKRENKSYEQPIPLLSTEKLDDLRVIFFFKKTIDHFFHSPLAM